MAPLAEDGAAGGDPFDGWQAAGVDPTRPNIARVYDYWLGGHHNLVADRELGEAMARLDPWIPAACKANRQFLGRAVSFLVTQGIRQFLDVGSGIPTAGNVHEVAQMAAPDARVVYVDRDPVVVAEGRKLLAGNDRAAVIQSDIRDPGMILSDPAASGLIDFGQPVAIILVAIMHFIRFSDCLRSQMACELGFHVPYMSVTSAPGEPAVRASRRKRSTRRRWWWWEGHRLRMSASRGHVADVANIASPVG